MINKKIFLTELSKELKVNYTWLYYRVKLGIISLPLSDEDKERIKVMFEARVRRPDKQNKGEDKQ